MRTDFERATRLGDVVHWAGELSARTMIFDVEPLVAYWDGGQEALDQGVVRVLSEVSVLPALQVLCFATNSSRRPSVVPSGAGLRVVYLASAGKPMRTAAYRGFPRPGMVIGDQVATDGILARRLGCPIDELERRDLKTALITLCIGAGMGTATIIERV